jgi:hypothetical protein
MQSSIRLALTAVTFALTLSSARGQQLPSGPVFPVNQPVTFRYSDAEGFGRITLTDLGPDTATGGDLMQVRIEQNGVRYDGSGIALIVSAERPFTTLITFTVVSPGGLSYFFHGRMGLGVEFQGKGTYHSVTDPSHQFDWGFLALPLPPSPGS